MPAYANLTPGDPAPWFLQRSIHNERFAFDTTGGRYIVLCFFGSAKYEHTRAAIDGVLSRRDIFDDTMASFFGVSLDPNDAREKRLADTYPGYRFFWDFDGTISRLYGAIPSDTAPNAGTQVPIRRFWTVLDPTLTVMKIIPFAKDQSDIKILLDFLDTLPPPDRFAGFELQAPILVLPNVFEPEFCRKLIGLYETHGGFESGFMREQDGKTVQVHDYSHKRRRDHIIEDMQLIRHIQAKFNRRVVPQIQKAYQFKVNRMERYIVSCYAAEDEAHFRAHRDNTTKGTAHRRFAVSVNLNDDFEGGGVSFPEYGPRTFKVSAGSAVVFSCSLLHAVSKVTRGRRYAFLPFLYDDEAAKIREENLKYLDDSVPPYVPDPPSAS